MPGQEDAPASPSLGADGFPSAYLSAASPHAGALAALALGLLVAVCFFPATEAGFVWDDEIFKEAKPVQDPFGLWQIWFSPNVIEREAHYWPVLYTTFWLEHKLWAFQPLGYHLVSLLLHLAVTLLLWRLLRRIEVPGAWLAAAVFAVHPVHVESAVWVIGRKDLLASLFYLGCVLAYLRFVEHGRWGRYALALALFALSLLSKAIAVTLPITLLIWHWWKSGRVTARDGLRIAPFVLLGLAIIAADLIYYRSIESRSFDYSLWERLLMAAQSLWFYAGKLVWPTDLAVIYPHWDLSPGNLLGWAAVGAGVAVVAGLWFSRHRVGRGPLAGVLFFAVTLSPVLGFVSFGYMRYSFVADRYQYLASAGIIAVLVGAMACGARHLPGKWRPGAPVAAAVLLATLGVLAWQQAGIYRDNITFYRHIVSVNPNAGHAYSNLGLAYQQEERHEEALAACRIAHRQAQEHPTDKSWNSWIHLCLGRSSVWQGRLKEAEEHYRRAVELQPVAVNLAFLAAFLVNEQGRSGDALEIFQRLVRMKPRNPDYHSGKAAALANLGRLDEALSSYDRSLELAPQQEHVEINRARVLRDLENRRQ
ncbi:MAG: tetratricopeptide repeat protein [Gammaproteobacteria bacterium]|nr:tetratricopeptide repeat protein [Gammaproteobacteria bacterium]